MKSRATIRFKFIANEHNTYNVVLDAFQSITLEYACQGDIDITMPSCFYRSIHKHRDDDDVVVVVVGFLYTAYQLAQQQSENDRLLYFAFRLLLNLSEDTKTEMKVWYGLIFSHNL